MYVYIYIYIVTYMYIYVHIYIYIFICMKIRGSTAHKMNHFRPFSLSLAAALPRPLKARFSFPNGYPNQSKIDSGHLLEAIASDNSIFH